MKRLSFVLNCLAILLIAPSLLEAQAPAPSLTSTEAGGAASVASLPAGYVIGPEDILSVVFWREKDLSVDVVVRPDGKISLPLLNDVQAAGYTPEQLADVVAKGASKYIADPLATVIIRQIHSRKVFVLGAVGRPGPVLLTSNMTVMQLIAQVGGLLEYADSDNITVVRIENGRERRIRFNYKDVFAGRNTEQNIVLQPGDTVLVR
jgi:polysaccharide export outer membrane protein